MRTDVEIAESTRLRPILQIADMMGLDLHEVEPYGHDKAKIRLEALERLRDRPPGKLILITAINPTPAGEGKTTVNVGLSMALNKLGYNALSTLREPSLGPCFGLKGGAAGGGYSQVLPMADINLHFTGDMHAVTSAHNLVAAMLDNSVYHGNPLQIDPKRITWPRVIDMNDRSLRNVVVGLGRRTDGVVRESGFAITVTSEVMAVLCLASGIDDLSRRISRMVVAYTFSGEPITVSDLGATGAVTLLLKDAIKPNLVQTTENTPALIHGGPFANIAHGCNSVLATRFGLALADFTVTEAGFGADLGAEKFFDIVCPSAGFAPDAVVLVATIRALKMNGGVRRDALNDEDLDALAAGSANLVRHLENLTLYGVPVVVAINRFGSDTDAELDALSAICEAQGVRAVVTDVFTRGSAGARDLAHAVVELCEEPAGFEPLYAPDLPLAAKIERIARRIYRAGSVHLEPAARRALDQITSLGYGHLPVCMAKTQYSFSDDPTRLGAPSGFELTVREVSLDAGAGFVVALTGDIMTMPGLPQRPAALNMSLDADGTITGLF